MPYSKLRRSARAGLAVVIAMTGSLFFVPGAPAGGTDRASGLNTAAAAALVGVPVDLGGNYTHKPGTTFSRHTTEPMGHGQIGGPPFVGGALEEAANTAAAAALVGVPVDLGGNYTHKPGTTFSRHTTEPIGHGQAD